MTSGWMLFLWALLALSVLTLVGVAVATYVRVRKRVNASTEEHPSDPATRKKS